MSLTRKILMLAAPIALAGAIALLLSSGKTPSTQITRAERAAKVRVVPATEVTVAPRAVGYGTVGPARAFQAVAEVKGPVVFKAQRLQPGEIVPAGMEILHIDDAPYRAAIARTEAQIESSKVKERTTRASLEIARRDLELLQDELDRKRELAKNGTVAKVTVETAERQMLAGRQQVQSLENELAVTIADRRVLEADLAQARIDLDNTVIAAPYDMRVTEVAVDEGTSVNLGQTLMQGDGLNAAEVEAQFPIGSLRPLIMARKAEVTTSGWELPVQAAVGLSALVRLESATHTVVWEGEVARVAGQVDPQTQSGGIVVRIDDPYAKAEPGRRPPLTRNTFVQVELVGPPLPGQIVVPASAVRDRSVHVVGPDNRLLTRAIEPGYAQGTAVVVASGLAAGELVVATDLVPAIEGMLLDPAEDTKMMRRMVADATGREPPSDGGGAGAAR